MKKLIKNPGRRNFVKSLGLALAGAGSGGGQAVRGAAITELEFDLQERDAHGKSIHSSATLDPRKTGIVVVDMWNYHWCRTCLARAGALVPRMNAAFDRARTLGMQMVFLPTDVILAYKKHPQRQAVLAMKQTTIPQRLNINPPNAIYPDYPYCDCGPGPQCLMNYGWTAMNPTLEIRANDLIADGEQEVYDICVARGLTHLIYAGISTNICLLGKPGAASNMLRDAMKCVFTRDLTDAITTYDPEHGFTPDRGTEEAIAEIEKSMPSIDLLATLSKTGEWEKDLVVDPVVVTPWGRMFDDAVKVMLSCPKTTGAPIRYTLDGSEPSESSTLYTQPFTVNDTCTLKTVGFHRGRKITLPSTAEFVRVPPAPPKADVYVSDLKSVSSKVGWPFNHHNGPGIDRSIGGNPLTVRGKEYKKGLGGHSVTEVVYEVKPEYRRFVALGGLDDEILGNDLGRFRVCLPSVVFRVYIDDTVVAASPLMGIQYVPWPFNIEIPAGSLKIKLVIDDPAGGAEALASPTYPDSYRDWWWTAASHLGHADWLEAGFVTSA
jgi:hypothetical protein